MLGDPVPLAGVPDGCHARPTLVSDGNNGWRLPKDRSGRAKITAVELTAAKQDNVELPVGADRRFLLGAETRRWQSIVAHYGDDEVKAWAEATKLCRAGLVTLTCTVTAAKLGPPTRWRRTQAVRAHVAAHHQRVHDGGEKARQLLAERHGGDTPTWVDGWLRDVERSGVIGRSGDDAARLLTTAAACLAALPTADGEPIGRGELAARHGGTRGAHALDDGHRLSALVLRGAAAATGQPYPRTAADRRALWASVGIACDTISATVLVANLRPEPTSLVATQLNDRADARLPMHLTARDLAAGPIRVGRVRVYACENPRVLEAALDRGVTVPLVCTAGNPTTVTVDLLRQIVVSGAEVKYRGDFDWPGVAIANRLLAATGCTTWRYDTEKYSAAVAETGGDAVPLTGTPVPANWDDALAPAMLLHGVAVHEELVLDDLLGILLEAA